MQGIKKGSLLVGCAMLLALFTGCESKTKNAYVPKTELVYASTKDIRNINPHLYGGEMSAQNMVFESLVMNTSEGVKPWLAQRWEISNDGKSYTFYLRKDVKFSDGSAFNAHVVKQNIDAIVDNRPRHAWLELVNQIVSGEVVDEFTYKLNLKNPYYPTLTELAMTRPFRFIAPSCFMEGGSKNGVSCYVGTGVWVLVEHEKNARALFKRNPSYWGEKPKLEQIKWRVMPDHQTVLLALQKGEIDLIFGADGDMIDLNAFSVLQKEGKYATLLSQPTASRAILLNTKQPITKEEKVREALQYAINKEAIVAGILNHSENIAHTLLSPTTPYCDVPLSAKLYDSAKAKALLEEAGWMMDEKAGYRMKEGKLLSLRFYFNAKNAQEKSISEYIQSNLKEIGVEVNIIGEEKQAFLDRQKSGDFDLQYSLSWGTPYDPQSYVSSWRMAAHGDYQAQLGLEKKAWLDEQIQAILIEPSHEARSKMYAEILTYVHNENVYVPLSYSRTKAIFTPHLKGVGFNPSQYEIAFEKMFFE
ncbi:nickel ABC transporter substrate-binding protein [Sulfurospirillum barnesii]|uniref:Nickel ABC transporter, nickel/metallophore periplasmic binding protein n=1 Tax=Sulfurospirillum barnesii (strain ATCC 700032 / DSM 10660 / SES-3) TaxID=760154 RepID=I3XZR3_SULBS|nr:nickel ABC transporter substrate-binding protein [Sulfurospirillum barnesii]AFL69437.1 nickel ABC transporter, nickel/metallophore periplasmic binding protein [Sulfurospirillum barnesii SES-3]